MKFFAWFIVIIHCRFTLTVQIWELPAQREILLSYRTIRQATIPVLLSSKIHHCSKTRSVLYIITKRLIRSSMFNGCRLNRAEEDLCARFPGELCAQVCVPTSGSSYRCECREGFQLLADGKSCQQSTQNDRYPPGIISNDLCFSFLLLLIIQRLVYG